jgi:hypothetical protein
MKRGEIKPFLAYYIYISMLEVGLKETTHNQYLKRERFSWFLFFVVAFESQQQQQQQ